MGTFSYYFPGETIVLKRAYLLAYEPETLENDLRNSDYLVLYPVTRGFLCERTSRFLDRQYHRERLSTPLVRVDGELQADGRRVIAFIIGSALVTLSL